MAAYSKKFLQIYFWQGISFILSFLSMFIVVPYLTAEKEIYGVYTVCLSINIFLSYADLGFIGAGQKYAAEYFAQGNRQKEISIIGFVSFVLLLFITLFFLGFLCLSFNPDWLIEGLTLGKNRDIAASLLLTLAVFSPVTLFQRIAQMIYGVRLEDYLIQRVNIAASLIKIASVFFFFSGGNYDIVGYFFFGQLVGLLAAVFSLYAARQRYHYDLWLLVRSVRFNKELFRKTKGLAFTSLYLTFTWILYYELDTVVISKMLGAGQVAIYAVGLTMMSFLRTIYAVLFAPFNARFNYFIGLNDRLGLQALLNKVFLLFAPLVIIPVLTISLMAEPLIISWVGPNYQASVSVAQMLVLCFIYGFITYPASIFLTAVEKVKTLYLVGTLNPLIYWVGIAISFRFYGLQAFAIFKFVAFTVTALAYTVAIWPYISLNAASIFRKLVQPHLLPVVFISVACVVTETFFPADKSKAFLLLAATIAITIMGIAFLLYYFLSPDLKTAANGILSNNFRWRKKVVATNQS